MAGFGKSFRCLICYKNVKWHAHRTRRGYAARCCRPYDINPTSGTMFYNTRVPLRSWFYLMGLFSNSRNGVSAHLAQRVLGTSHGAAYRICDRIRTHMALLEGQRSIGGPGVYVHIDEALFRGIIGGNPRNRQIIFGMATKDCVVSFAIENRKAVTLLPLIQKYVHPESIIVTDSHRSYARLARLGWRHEIVNHAKFLWVNENGIGQSQIETYWGHLKRSFRATHLHIDQKNIWKYIQEFNFRYNRRHRSGEIFWDMISCFPPFFRETGEQS